MKQTSSIGIMDFIRPHKGGFLSLIHIYSPSKFAAVFKEAKGKTPLEYRRES